MKLISWNVNGIRACLEKGFMESFRALDADVFCLQETKCQAGQVTLELPGYHQYWNAAEKKGYSGTALFTRREPLGVRFGIGVDEFDHEGRVIAADLGDFWMVTVYTPNAQEGLKRLDWRMAWEDAFLAYLKALEREKPVIFCGDLNVAHREIDLKNPASNHMNPGFTDREREKFGRLLEQGFVDTFRYFYPDRANIYSWWSYRFHARDNNAGWRIDYFMASDALRPRLQSAAIHNEVFGSDHCPVELVIGE